MSSVAHQGPAAVAWWAGSALGVVAVGVLVAGSGAGVPLGLVAFGVLALASYEHDRRHRRRGELPHALWGLADKNKPRWLTRPR